MDTVVSDKFKNFDAFTGGACGQGAIRVLASQFVVPQDKCNPSEYISLSLLAPEPSQYASGIVDFLDGAGNTLGTVAESLNNGTVDLETLSLNSITGLPQFLITLTGAPISLGEVTLQLRWRTDFDPECVGPTTEVVQEPTSLTTTLNF